MPDYYVYMLTNTFQNVLYIGVTNNLERRLSEHRLKIADGFTKKYNLDCLVYYETYASITEAISREKQLKSWRRAKKNNLVAACNPTWQDLSKAWYPQRNSA